MNMKFLAVVTPPSIYHILSFDYLELRAHVFCALLLDILEGEKNIIFLFKPFIDHLIWDLFVDQQLVSRISLFAEIFRKKYVISFLCQ